MLSCLEKYFEMNKKNCREALDVYKKFLARMDRVCGFLKVAEVCDIYLLFCIRWFIFTHTHPFNGPYDGLYLVSWKILDTDRVRFKNWNLLKVRGIYGKSW